MHEIHSKWKRPRQRVKRGKSANMNKARKCKEKAKEVVAPTTAPAPARPADSAHSATPRRPRSANKLSRFDLDPAAVSENDFLIVHETCLSELVGCFECPVCKLKNQVVTVSNKKGFSMKFQVKCSVCDTVHNEVFSSPRVKDSDSSRPAFEVNRKMAAAFLDIGCGHTAMTRFCSALGLPCMDVTSFYSHMKKISEENKDLRKRILEETRRAVRLAHIEADPSLKNEPIIDITVSVDGSWHKRGHSSLFGFVSAIDVLTGLVLDWEILSKFCLLCSLAASQHGQDSDDFKVWHKEHLERNECSKNFEDSSGNMESAGAVILFKRSIQEAGLRYTVFLSDGDAKTLSELNKAKPYGPSVEIAKEECINHVSKRMGTALRNVVKDNKKAGVTLGGKAAGALTEATMKVLQGYYHSAIKNNIPDVKLIKKAVLATLHHCASTDAKPMHMHCPPGKDSWCFYNKNKAIRRGRNKNNQSHATMKIKLNKTVFDALLPIYQRLSSDELLERCASGGTQNANEALHSVIWKKCPKNIFISKVRMEYGITQAIREFNMGCSALQVLRSQVIEQPISKTSLNLAAQKDSKRKAQSSRQEEIVTKKLRIERKHSKKKENKFGTANYGAGAGD